VGLVRKLVAVLETIEKLPCLSLRLQVTVGLVRKLVAVLETIEKLPVYLYDSR
jgi:hypothetical protein